MKTNTQHISAIHARLLVFMALLVFVCFGISAALAETFNLRAKPGSMPLPGGATVTVWGYCQVIDPATDCAPPTLPGGPTLIVNQGDNVEVNLTNNLPEASSMLFQGQAMVPDTAGAAASSGTKTYNFTATNPGTFLYEAGLLPNAQHQAAMGLHGALIVRPAVTLTGISVKPSDSDTRIDAGATYTSGSNIVLDTDVLSTDNGAAVSGAGIPFGTTITSVTAGTSFTMSAPAVAAYGDSTVVNDETVLVLSELDPALNNSANPATFDMRNYAPKYFLINGKAYPNTAPIASAAGHKVLLRYVNAGIQHHSMAVLGLRQNFVAKDANLLPTLTHNVAAETLAPGQTGDAIATVPAVTTASKFAVYDGSLALHNNGADNAFGGMLTFVTAGTGDGATGPTTSGVALTPNLTNGSVSVALSASINSTSSTVAAAEYFIDTTGAAGSGIAMGGTFGTATVSVNATISAGQLTALASGNHTIFVHGQDATTPTAQWGAFSSAALNLDKTGPVTSGLTLTPNPSNGTVSVALSATGNDSASGGSNITAAEYTIDGGPAVTMTLGGSPAPVRSLTANIPAGLTVGPHTVTIRSQDALGNWGAFAPITLNVVASGPVTSGVSAAKNPNNGALPLSASQPVVRVTATMTSTGSTISTAEGFIDSNPATTVRGFPFVPSDGAFNSATETGYADIPLSTINALSAGNHTIYVRGKDAAGNWGATSTTVLLIDKTAPTFTSVTLSPTTAIAGETVTLTATGAADTGGAGLSGGQYWIDGTITPPANPTAFTGTSTTFSVLTGGVHTVYVRVGDAAVNWSTVRSATLTLPSAVNDALTLTANNNVTQTSNQAAPGVLANDLPVGMAGRTATLVSGPVRTSGTGAGTIAVTCPPSLTPGICTNGSYRVTLNGIGANGPARAASKRGIYQFTYTETLNGKTTLPATVTITVN